MRKWGKSAAFLLMLVLCLVCCLPVAAAGLTATTTAEISTLQVGQEITFTLQVTGSETATVLAVKYGDSFDREVFTFVSAQWQMRGALQDIDVEKGNAVLAFQKATCPAGAVFSLTLRVEAVPATATAVELPLVVKNGTEPVAVTAVAHVFKPAESGTTTVLTTTGIPTTVEETTVAGVSATPSAEVSGGEEITTAASAAAEGHTSASSEDSAPPVLSTEAEPTSENATTDPLTVSRSLWLWMVLGVAVIGTAAAGVLLAKKKGK